MAQKEKTDRLLFAHKNNEYDIIFVVEAPDFWFSIDGFDIHYCEDYNEICIYQEEDYSKSIYSRKIKSN